MIIFAGKISTMFTQGQLVFSAVFFVAFVIAGIFVYRKDKALHRQHYKGSYRVLIGFLLFIAFLFVMKGYLKH
jgi:heme A synthase